MKPGPTCAWCRKAIPLAPGGRNFLRSSSKGLGWRDYCSIPVAGALDCYAKASAAKRAEELRLEGERAAAQAATRAAASARMKAAIASGERQLPGRRREPVGGGVKKIRLNMPAGWFTTDTGCGGD